ncbi:MAG: sigma-54 dependent transcriptional regulator [Planctomycetota bacterium]
MKLKRLSDYLDLMKSAQEQKDYQKVKRLGEAALKKFYSLTGVSPLEKYFLYHRLGNAYSKLFLYSSSLDLSYKAYLIASKHHLKPEFLASISHNLGGTFRVLRNPNQALRYLQKVEQYYQKYGNKRAPMTSDMQINNWIHMAHCYLQKNETEKMRELLEHKISPKLTTITNKGVLVDYYLARGNYFLQLREHAQAKECFQKGVQLSRQERLDRWEVQGKNSLAILAIIEGQVISAIEILNNTFRETRQKKMTGPAYEVALLLRTCYRFMSLASAGTDPIEQSKWENKGSLLERRLKSMVRQMDHAKFYESNKQAEEIFYQLQKEGQFSPTARKFLEIPTKTIGPENAPSSYQEVLIGKSALMQEVYYLVEKTAPTDLPILIYGETGAGKELVARAIHQRSLRSRRTWLACNTGAIPETLLESELFGYVKGAFTGAQSDKKGYIELASDGTLFLDEVGNMSLGMQQKLLRVMEDNLLWRVGAEKEIPVKTRFVLASNEDLEELVKAKRFREDLLYRINTIIITLPPLRERKEDIPLLTQHFLKKCLLPRQALPEISSGALALLTNYFWSGNVRELENEIKRILVLHPQAKQITEEMLSEAVRGYRPNLLREISETGKHTFSNLTEIFQRNLINQTITDCGGNLSQAARRLGYDRRNLYRKMKQLKMPVP